MVRVVSVAVIALLASPAAAGAQAPTPLPPLEYAGPTASIARGAPLTFAVRTSAPAGSLVVRVSGSNTVDAQGMLSGPDGTWLDETATPAAADLQVWTVPATSILRKRPGHYFWQAYVNGDAAQSAAAPVGPVQALDVTLPQADRGTGKLYPRWGRPGSARFALSSSNLPAAVTAARFELVARTAAARWGLRAQGWTDAVAGVRDGRSVAGFSDDLPEDVLGLETDFIRQGAIVERDLALRAGENWNAGPQYPALDQIDMESVLLHELGHMAGNRRHRPQCANSPMVEALGAGEWWRGAHDHWFGSCARTVSSAAAIVRRLIRVD